MGNYLASFITPDYQPLVDFLRTHRNKLDFSHHWERKNMVFTIAVPCRPATIEAPCCDHDAYQQHLGKIGAAQQLFQDMLMGCQGIKSFEISHKEGEIKTSFRFDEAHQEAVEEYQEHRRAKLRKAEDLRDQLLKLGATGVDMSHFGIKDPEIPDQYRIIVYTWVPPQITFKVADSTSAYWAFVGVDRSWVK